MEHGLAIVDGSREPYYEHQGCADALAYKAGHVIDLDRGMILTPQIHPGDAGDTATIETSAQKAEAYTADLSMPVVIEELVADKGHHPAATLAAYATPGAGGATD